ncbi:MAG: NAD(P)/FAD-dependent oxidoreductase [Polyangiales bacterium]
MEEQQRPHLVIVGAGFAGLTLARALRRTAVRITLVDRQNHHLFQPLLYQVATAGLAPADIAVPVRSVLRKQRNLQVLLGEVVDVDAGEQRVALGDGRQLHYDQLVVAAGAQTNFFGNENWAEHCFGLKSLDDALNIRERILRSFEEAEKERDEARRRALLTFVVVGGGPTGVEMAGAISELARHTLRKDFRSIDPAGTRVVLVEMADRVLLPFSESLSESAKAQLEELHVELRTGVRVEDLGPDFVLVDGERIPSSMTCWAAGVRPSPLAGMLGVALERGRVPVQADCSVEGQPNLFVVGDMAAHRPTGESQPLPGVAPVAMQQARFVAKLLKQRYAGKTEPVFRYLDKGMMATIGRSRAVLESGPLRLSGTLAWLGWLVVHLLYLVGFRNRVMVLVNWVYSYFTFKRGSRLIVRPKATAVPEHAGAHRDDQAA